MTDNYTEYITPDIQVTTIVVEGFICTSGFGSIEKPTEDDPINW